MGNRRETVRYEEDSARGSIYPLLCLGPASRRCILAKTPRGLNLGTSQNFLKKQSEKGYEQRFERGCRRCREAKMGRNVPFRWSVRLHRRLFRPCSDGFKANVAEILFYVVR
jgi:hypothetical protein